MKKILTASLVAMMAVTAARADIASTKYVDDAATAITDTIGTVPADKTVVQMITDAVSGSNTGLEAAKTYTDTEVGKVSSALTTYQTNNNAAVALKADKTALEAEVTARSEADTAINTKIGTVPAGKTVVGLIGEAQTAATYDDAEVRGLISDNANAIAAEILRADAAEKANAKAIEDMGVAYKAADTELDGKITAEATARSNADDALSGRIDALAGDGEGSVKAQVKEVSEALDSYKTANNTAVAAAKKAGDDAQAYAEGVNTALNTYKTENDAAVVAAKKAGDDAAAALNTYKTENNAAVAAAQKAGDDAAAALNTYKTENNAAVAAAQKAGDDAQAAANKAQGEVDTLEGVVAGKQPKSEKLSLGAADGAWVDLTSATANYQTTGTYSLTLVNGTPYWTEVK